MHAAAGTLYSTSGYMRKVVTLTATDDPKFGNGVHIVNFLLIKKHNLHASTIQTQHHSQETSRNKHSQIYIQIIINHNIGKSNDVKHARAK